MRIFGEERAEDGGFRRSRWFGIVQSVDQARYTEGVGEKDEFYARVFRIFGGGGIGYGPFRMSVDIFPVSVKNSIEALWCIVKTVAFSVTEH